MKKGGGVHLKELNTIAKRDKIVLPLRLNLISMIIKIVLWKCKRSGWGDHYKVKYYVCD